MDGLDIFLTVSGEIFLMGRWEVGFYNVNGNEKREEIYEPKLLKNLSGVEDFIQSKEFLIFKCENGLKIWKGGSTIKNLNKEKYNETLNGLFNSKGGRIPSFKDLDWVEKKFLAKQITL